MGMDPSPSVEFRALAVLFHARVVEAAREIASVFVPRASLDRLAMLVFLAFSDRPVLLVHLVVESATLESPVLVAVSSPSLHRLLPLSATVSTVSAPLVLRPRLARAVLDGPRLPMAPSVRFARLDTFHRPLEIVSPAILPVRPALVQVEPA